MYKRFIVAAALARALQPHIRRRHRSRLNRATSADEDGMVCTLERLYGTTSVWGDLDAADKDKPGGASTAAASNLIAGELDEADVSCHHAV